MKPRVRLFIATLLVVSTVGAAEPKILALWPGDAPGETATFPPEIDVTVPTDRQPGGRRVTRISNVSAPTLAIYSPDAAIDTGAAVLVFPGGGYVRLAMDIEGTEVCEWLNTIGVKGVLVKYRVPRREGLPQYLPPVQDAQRALGLIRHRARELGIDSERIGVIGFSAGAHVAAVLSTNQDKRLYPQTDPADDVSCRPDFAMLIYPGYFRAGDHNVAAEVAVMAGKTPPTFLAMAQDDPVHVENAVYYYLALKKANVPAEMHLYPTGGHGFGLRKTDAAITTWPDRATEWMKASGWLREAVQSR